MIFSNVLLLNAQPRNDIIGKFIGNTKNIYHHLDFQGKGFVKINNEFNGEFYYENDSLFVFTGTDIAIYKIEKGKLVGLSEWVKKETLKLQKNLIVNDISFPEWDQRAIWLKAFYQNNNQLQLKDLVNIDDLENHFKQVNAKNEQLCAEGFDLACIQNYSFLLMKITTSKDLPNQEELYLQLKKIATKVIDLGNADGYGLLYSYYVLRDEEEKGIEYLDIGLEKGSQLCLKLSLDKSMNIME